MTRVLHVTESDHGGGASAAFFGLVDALLERPSSGSVRAITTALPANDGSCAKWIAFTCTGCGWRT